MKNLVLFIALFTSFNINAQFKEIVSDDGFDEVKFIATWNGEQLLTYAPSGNIFWIITGLPTNWGETKEVKADLKIDEERREVNVMLKANEGTGYIMHLPKFFVTGAKELLLRIDGKVYKWDVSDPEGLLDSL